MSEYEPFGEEWKKEVMKFKKEDLVEMLREKCMEDEKRKQMMSDLTIRLNSQND